MAHAATGLLSNALALPGRERAKIAHELLLSLDDGADDDANEAWVAELERACQRGSLGLGPQRPAEVNGPIDWNGYPADVDGPRPDSRSRRQTSTDVARSARAVFGSPRLHFRAPGKPGAFSSPRRRAFLFRFHTNAA